MSKKKRKPLPRIGGKATAVTPSGKEAYTRKKLVELDAKVLPDDGLYEKPMTHTHRSELRTRVLNKEPITPSTDRLPGDVARRIIKASRDLVVDRDKLPDIPDGEVNRIINENPEIALEGLTKLGRVMSMPSAVAEENYFNPLEIKARVMGDMRKGFVDDSSDQRAPEYRGNMPMFTAVTVQTLQTALQIDVQAVYDRWMTTKGNDLYELKMAPPWNNAVLMYNNQAGNVWALHMVASDIRGNGDWDTGWDEATMTKMRWDPEPPADHTIEWERVRWICSVQVYVGGYGQVGSIDGLTNPKWVQTVGPLMVWRIAVYEDGTPADVNWTHLVPAVPLHKFNNALGVLTETLNMANCVNVTVAYPTRPMQRAQRRRFERMGVRFSEIHVKPASKSYKGAGQALADMEMPLHGVRGHYSTYGSDGRGLLFGKLAGRFWIPPHVRGTAAVGEVAQSYVAE